MRINCNTESCKTYRGRKSSGLNKDFVVLRSYASVEHSASVVCVVGFESEVISEEPNCFPLL